MLLKFASICTILRLVREVVVLLDYNVTGQTGFSIHWDGSVIVAEFNGFVVSPVGVTNVITSLRNAVEYRGHEKWAQIVKIKDGKKIKQGHIYLIPPANNLTYEDNKLHLVEKPKDQICVTYY